MNAVPIARRPVGITVTCVLLWWLSFAGFLNALILPTALGSVAAPVLLRAPPAVVGVALAIVAALYGLTALTAAVGLWYMRSWGPRAFIAWGVVVCGCMVLFLTLVRLPPDTPLIAGVAFVAFMAVLLWGWWAYLRRAYARAGAAQTSVARVL